jgi:hypothetical protein
MKKNNFPCREYLGSIGSGSHFATTVPLESTSMLYCSSFFSGDCNNIRSSFKVLCHLYLTLLHREWNTECSVSEIENCLPIILSYLVPEIALGSKFNLTIIKGKGEKVQ